MFVEMLAAWVFHQANPQQVPGQLVRELLGTASLTHSARRDRGELVGCENVFRVLEEDNLYANGGLITLDGSLNLFAVDAGYFGSIKISGRDVFMSDGQPVTVPYESDYGYFLSADTGEPYSVLASFQCEDGGYCASVDAETLIEMLGEIAVHGRLEGALNRSSGSTDLPFAIEAEGTGWRFAEFFDCAERLMGRAQ